MELRRALSSWGMGAMEPIKCKGVGRQNSDEWIGGEGWRSCKASRCLGSQTKKNQKKQSRINGAVGGRGGAVAGRSGAGPEGARECVGETCDGALRRGACDQYNCSQMHLS